MVANTECLAAFDIGATKTALLLADRSGRRLALLREPTESGGGSPHPYRDGWADEAVSGQLVRLLRRGLEEARSVGVAGIGVGAPGPIDAGDLRNPPNVKASEGPSSSRPLYVPIVDRLEQAFGRPVVMRNDCRAAVLGEVHFGVGKDVTDKARLFLAYVTVSTGFGAGVWDGGHLLVGKDGNAGEVGHLVAEENGLLCGCGNRGCVEAYCSGVGIVGNARDRLSRAAKGEGTGAGRLLRRLVREAAEGAGEPLSEEAALDRFLTPQRVFEAAELGDPLACETIDDALHAAGIAFAGISNAYDPEVISVGGGLALAHPELLPRIEVEMRRHLNVRAPAVRLTPLGEETVLCGALVLAKEAASLARPSSPGRGRARPSAA